MLNKLCCHWLSLFCKCFVIIILKQNLVCCKISEKFLQNELFVVIMYVYLFIFSSVCGRFEVGLPRMVSCQARQTSLGLNCYYLLLYLFFCFWFVFLKIYGILNISYNLVSRISPLWQWSLSRIFEICNM